MSKSPFLSEEEMDEFNQHVKIHMSDAPLLPKREFVVLNNQEVSLFLSLSYAYECIHFLKNTFWLFPMWKTAQLQFFFFFFVYIFVK